jgi:hypothetical protein
VRTQNWSRNGRGSTALDSEIAALVASGIPRTPQRWLVIWIDTAAKIEVREGKECSFEVDEWWLTLWTKLHFNWRRKCMPPLYLLYLNFQRISYIAILTMRLLGESSLKPGASVVPTNYILYTSAQYI